MVYTEFLSELASNRRVFAITKTFNAHLLGNSANFFSRNQNAKHLDKLAKLALANWCKKTDHLGTMIGSD